MVEFFANAYRDGGTPTWDLGRPQGAVVRLAEAGLIVGSVLDAGCGTGENALYLAELGHAVLGVDIAAEAIDRAAAKAADRGRTVELRVGDALDLATLGRSFDTALDSGLFHTLSDTERPRYAASLGSVIRPGGRAFILCWSDRNPFGRGPRRVSQRELRAAFSDGWAVEAIDPEWLDTRLPEGRVHAWLARIARLATVPDPARDPGAAPGRAAAPGPGTAHDPGAASVPAASHDPAERPAWRGPNGRRCAGRSLSWHARDRPGMLRP